jgi:hypothetical protein
MTWRFSSPCIAHEGAQQVLVEVLGDVVVGAGLHRLHRGLDVGDRGDHDAFDEGIVLLDDPQHVEAADAGQPHIEQQQPHLFLAQEQQCRLAARRRQDAVLRFEDGLERVAHRLVVIADQDRFRRRHVRAILTDRLPGSSMRR